MNEIIKVVENVLINNQETISLNALKEICKLYGIYNDNEIIKLFKDKNLINTKLQANYLPDCLQIEFIKRSRNNDSLAKKLLVVTNYNLVLYLVNQIYKSDNNEEDLIEYGIMGLLHAIDNYDLNTDILFNSYASKCIKGMIKRYLPTIMYSLKINRNLFYLLYKINKIEKKLMIELNKEKISDLEILTELKKDKCYYNISEKNIFYIRNFASASISLDKELIVDNETSNNYMKDCITSNDNVEETVSNNLTYELIRKIINREIDNNLTDKELAVLYYRYGFDESGIIRTSFEVAKILNISGSRVRYIENDALKKLRRMEILKNIK